MKTQTLRARAIKLLCRSRYTLDTTPAIALLVDFAAQNSGMDPRNYDSARSYRSEAAGITRDWQRFSYLFQVASMEGVTDTHVINASLSAFSGRLSWKGDRWEYCTGQYFPTEYRNAACAVLDSAIRLVRQERPKQKAAVSSIAELRALNERNGGTWFDKSNMRFFGTRFESGILFDRYFITSEQPPHGARVFTVRTFDDEGSVDTLGDFAKAKSKAEAMEQLRQHLANETAKA